MNPLTLNVMLLLFLVAALTTFWRWTLRRNGIHGVRFLIFAGGVLFYAWLQSPYYVEELSRWYVRALLVAWVLPELLENVEIIREERKKHRG